MSSSVQPTQQLSQLPASALTGGQVASILGPGLVGLLIQGIETGLIFAQFSRWFSKYDRNGSPVLSIVVIFVTIVGLCVSPRLFISQTLYLSSFMKCADRDMLCIYMAYVRTAFWVHRSTFRFSPACCIISYAQVVPQTSPNWEDVVQSIPVRVESLPSQSS